MALDFPWQIGAYSCDFHPANTSRSGGRGLTGSQQVIASNAGYWTAQIEVPVFREERTLAYRAVRAALHGAAGEVLVPALTRWRALGDYGNPVSSRNSMVPSNWAVFADEQALWDLSGIGQTEDVFIHTTGAAERGATALTLRHPRVEGLRPGHYFGINDRLYIVLSSNVTETEVVTFEDQSELAYGSEDIDYADASDEIEFGVDGDPVRTGVNRSEITFWPRLREAAPHDTHLLLGRPVCRMRLVSDDSGVLSQRDMRSGVAVLEFEEVV